MYLEISIFKSYSQAITGARHMIASFQIIHNFQRKRLGHDSSHNNENLKKIAKCNTQNIKVQHEIILKIKKYCTLMCNNQV